jgi:hypothetical protein
VEGDVLTPEQLGKANKDYIESQKPRRNQTLFSVTVGDKDIFGAFREVADFGDGKGDTLVLDVPWPGLPNCFPLKETYGIKFRSSNFVAYFLNEHVQKCKKPKRRAKKT